MKKRWRRTGRVLVALLLAVCSLSVNLSPVLAVTQADIEDVYKRQTEGWNTPFEYL